MLECSVFPQGTMRIYSQAQLLPERQRSCSSVAVNTDAVRHGYLKKSGFDIRTSADIVSALVRMSTKEFTNI